MKRLKSYCNVRWYTCFVIALFLYLFVCNHHVIHGVEVDKPDSSLSRDIIFQKMTKKQYEEYLINKEKAEFEAMGNRVEAEGYLTPAKIGKTLEGRFSLFLISNPEDDFYAVFPELYNRNGDNERSNFKLIVAYVIGGKKYTKEKFARKYPTGKTYFDKEKIMLQEGKVFEVYGILDDGTTTPSWYMILSHKKNLMEKLLEKKDI